MTPTELILKVRFEINDNDSTNGYRFSRLDFEQWIPDAVRDVYRKRPDIRLNSRFEMNVCESLYDYDASDFVFESYDDIFGWDKTLFPILTFTASADNNLIASASGNDLFSVVYEDAYSIARVNNLLPGGEFGGVVFPIKDVLNGESFTVSVIEKDIPIDFFVERALVYYLAYSAFSVDNEDTFNAGRAQEYYTRFLSEIGVSSNG